MSQQLFRSAARVADRSGGRDLLHWRAKPEHKREGNADQVCTLHVNFAVREGRLHATAVMRSNDVVKGLAFDMPWFVSQLPRMAGEVSWPVGTYTHMAHSMHLYERDVPVAEEMLGRPRRVTA